MPSRIIPYLSLAIGSLLVWLISSIVENQTAKAVLISVFSNSIFFFLVYLLYDLIRQSLVNKEKRLLVQYIRSDLSSTLFSILYSLKKIIHGYNLESNTLENIVGQVNYKESEVFAAICNQSYLGFQIFKNGADMRELLKQAVNSNIVLKYSSYMEITMLLQIANNLVAVEAEFKNTENFIKQAESGVEYRTIDGKQLNPSNPERILLAKMTSDPQKFVVYDSGEFAPTDRSLLLNRYTLKSESAERIAVLVSSTLYLMKKWLPETAYLERRNRRFRIIDNFFSPNTNVLTGDVEVHVADIIRGKWEA